MPLQFACPSCRQQLRMGEELVGQLVRCPGCLHEFVAGGENAVPMGIKAPTERPSPPAPNEINIREGEPPPRKTPGLPQFDRYEEDEFGGPVGRRSEGLMERARSRVSGPANGLLAVGYIGIALTVFGVALNLLGVFADAGAGRGKAGGAPIWLDATASLISLPFSVAMCALVIVGAYKMK